MDRVMFAQTFMCEVLLRQVKEKKYDVIAALWESSGLNNSQIRRYDNSKLGYSISATNMVLVDIVKTVTEFAGDEGVNGNTKLMDLFYNLMAAQYKVAVSDCKKLRAAADLCDEDEFMILIKRYMDKAGMPKLSMDRNRLVEDVEKVKYARYTSEQIFRIFLIEYMDVDVNSSEMILAYYMLVTESIFNNAGESYDYPGDDEYYYNTDEEIANSPTFERFCKRRIDELIKYVAKEYELPVTTEEGLYLAMGIICKSNDGVHDTRVSCYTEGIATHSAIDIFSSHGGVMSWYNMLTNEKAENYQPNMRLIVKRYLWSLVKMESDKYNEMHDEDMPKIYLARDVKPSAREMFLCITHEYNMDIIYHLHEIILDEFYENFSFERLLKKEEYIKLRSGAAIDELEEKIQGLQEELLREKKRYEAAQKRLIEKYSDNDKFLDYERQISKLNKVVDEKDAEIESLKQQLRSQEEFADLVNREEDELDADKNVDMDLLKSKRYLFVGNVERHLPDLKKEFPGSVFMDTRSTNISGIKVDGVVLLTKFMGHPMYYKLRNTKEIRGLKWVYCNTKNLDVLHQKMMELV